MKVTNFEVFDADNNKVSADAHGNNIAFICPRCGHPVLAVMFENQRGSSREKPTLCKGCHTSFWMEVFNNHLVLNQG